MEPQPTRENGGTDAPLSQVQNPQPPPLSATRGTPGFVRRGIAKAIDLIAAGFTVVGFSTLTHSYLAGLLIGYGWLALSDFAGSLGKWLLRLEVRDWNTGMECSARASILRNLPIIASALPHRLHQAWLGLDRQQYREDYPGVILVMAGLSLIVWVAMLVSYCRDDDRRHLGDGLADTVVTSRIS